MVYKRVFSRTNYFCGNFGVCGAQCEWPLPLFHQSQQSNDGDALHGAKPSSNRCFQLSSQLVNFGHRFSQRNNFYLRFHSSSVIIAYVLFILIFYCQLPFLFECFPTSSSLINSTEQQLSVFVLNSLPFEGNAKKATRNVKIDRPTNDWFADTANNQSKIIGFRLEGNSRNIIENEERYVIKADQEVSIRLFVQNIQTDFLIGFSSVSQAKAGQSCRVEEEFKAKFVDNYAAIAKIFLPANPKPYHLCFSYNQSEGNDHDFFYAGSNVWFQIKSEAPMLPMWLHISLLILLLTMSGLFSGLNLGLMALDKNELQVIERCGTEDEKYYAKTISPVRKRGNYLLCTLLLGNVLVNSTLTILLDDLTSGIFAVIGSTLSIVIFGEIIPQALCSRHGLAVGAKTVYITYLFMILTFPLSYPISRLLDKILGEEIGSVYDRERLMEYIRVTKDYNNLEADEMNIISGALKFKKISVADVMTPITDVFMLPYDAILNFDTLTLINNSGYSRIPVYENNRDNVVGLLHVKDLSLIDPDHNLPLKVVLDFYSHPLLAVYEDVKLDKMLNEFKQGKSHMALIRRVIDNGINDPYFELLGVVTLEDIIEELIQAEINDETDVISDNRRKQKRQDVQSRSNYLEFIRTGFRQKHLNNSNSVDVDCSSNSVVISPQLALAAFRFLASSVGPFNSDQISEEVLKVLMAKNIYFEAKGEPRRVNIDDMSAENVLYKRGRVADYFIMILEGRARVIVTKENQEYDAGPFCCFGIGALTTTNPPSEEQNKSINDESMESLSQRSSNPNISQNTDSVFIPDYTLICIEKVVYMKVTKNFHQMALKATNIERKRSIDIPKSQSQMNNNDDNNSDSEIGVSKPILSKNLKNLPPKYRKISMGTNLPDSSLIQDFNLDEIDRPHLMKSLTVDPKPRDFKRNEFKRKSSPVELALKRSDAIELLTGNASPRSYGSIESLGGDVQTSLLTDKDNSATIISNRLSDLKEKITLNGSLTALDQSTPVKHNNEEEKSTLI